MDDGQTEREAGFEAKLAEKLGFPEVSESG